MLLAFPKRGLRLNGSAKLDVFLPDYLLQALALRDVGNDASNGGDPPLVVEQRELVNDAGVQQAVAIRSDLLDLDSDACRDHLGVVLPELRCKFSWEDL